MILLITTEPSTCSGKISNDVHVGYKINHPFIIFHQSVVIGNIDFVTFFKGYIYLEFEMDREKLFFFFLLFFLFESKEKQD